MAVYDVTETAFIDLLAQAGAPSGPNFLVQNHEQSKVVSRAIVVSTAASQPSASSTDGVMLAPFQGHVFNGASNVWVRSLSREGDVPVYIGDHV